MGIYSNPAFYNRRQLFAYLNFKKKRKKIAALFKGKYMYLLLLGKFDNTPSSNER